MNNYLFEEPTALELSNEELVSEREIDNSIAELESNQVLESYQYLLKSSLPTLKPEEIKKLYAAILEGGQSKKNAEDKIVRSNIRLVAHLARRYEGHGCDMDDLVSMGLEGLLKAIEKFDPDLGFTFATYATWWIKQAIGRGIYNECSTVRIPVHQREINNKVRRATAELSQMYNITPTADDIATLSGLSVTQVENSIKSNQNIIYLNKKVGDDEESELIDLIPDENMADPYEQVEKTMLREAVERVFEHLTEREALVLRLRNGVGCSRAYTLEEISNLPEFNCTRERVRQIEARAISKIRRSPSLRRELLDFAS